MNDLRIEYYQGKMILYLDKLLPTSRKNIKKIFDILQLTKDPEMACMQFGYRIGMEYNTYNMLNLDSKAERLKKNMEYFDELFIKKFGGDKI